MSAVEDRIVQMSFDNRTFETGVAKTLGTLDRLKNALSFGGAKRNGLDDVQASASRFNLNGVANGIDGISKKFSALSVIGITALATLTNKAVNAGIALVKSFTINPIADGFQQYQQQINATQTILANTASSGANLKSVTATLNVLNDYANKTIYNFSDMATNLGTFTSAGIKLGPASDAIQGLSNVAAAAGAGTQQAAGAMYQLSQALGRGKLQAQDWNSVVAAGMASSNFKNAILETAKSMGTIKMPKTQSIQQWIKAGGSFQDAMSKGQITSGVLIQTLQAMTGNMTNAQLAAKGYSKAQIVTIQQMASQAKAAAVNVKTVTALVDNLKQGVGSAWASVFKTIFGDLPTATKEMTTLSGVLNNIFVEPINRFNVFLKQFVKLGGLNSVIGGLVNIFHALGAVVKPFKQAFSEIFPPASAKALVLIATRFQLFTKNLIVGTTTADKIKRSFAGIFAIFKIGETIIKQAYLLFLGLFNSLPKGKKGILDVTSGLGDFLVHLEKMLVTGGGIASFFGKLYGYLQAPIAALGTLKNALTSLFTGFSTKGFSGISSAFHDLSQNMHPIVALGNQLQKVMPGIHKVMSDLKPAVDAIVHVFANLGNSISTALQSGNFTGILSVIKVGLLGGIVVMLKKFFKTGIHIDVGGGFLKTAKETFEGLTGNLKAMQTQLKAKALLEIAGAITLIVASVAILSTINPKTIGNSLKALAIGFGELLGSMAVLTKIGGVGGALKLPLIAASLVALSGAILVLVGAVKLMSTMSWDQLKKGLTGVGLLLGGLSLSALVLSKSSVSMVTASIGITAIAVAMNILFGAVKLFSTLSWKEMLKGLAGVFGSLTAIAVAMRLMPKGMALQAAAIFVIATSLNVLYLAVKQFSSFNWKEMGKGLAGIVGSLAGIAGAMRLMPKGMVLQAAAIVVISGALLILGKALDFIGNLSWKIIGKGLTGVAGALGVLALALSVMDGTLPGALAVYVVAKALGVMVPILEAMATLKWGDIGKGLAVVASVLAIFIAAGYGADGAAVGLLAISVAAVGLGAGLALAGLGLKAIAEGFGILAKSGTAGVAVLLSAVTGLIAQIPAIATAFAQGLINILVIIGKNGPAIVAALGTIIGSLTQAIIDQTPNIVKALGTLLQGLFQVLTDNTPGLIAAGFKLLLDLLSGIYDNIGQVTTTVVLIIIRFLNTLADHIGDIVASGLNLLVKFLEGIAGGIGRVASAGASIVVHMISGIGTGIDSIVSAGANAAVSFIVGMGKSANRIVSAGAHAIESFITGLGKNAIGIVTAAALALLNFLDGLDSAVKTYEPQIIEKSAMIGVHMITGIISGLGNLVSKLVGIIKDKVGSVITTITDWFGGPLRCASEDLGAKMLSTIGDGITKSDALGNSLTDKLNSTLAKVPAAINGLVDFNPTITPILDLSSVQKDAARLSSLVTTDPIIARGSFTQAATISAAQLAASDAAQTAADAAQTPAAPISIKLEQNNTSPIALSTLDIYRLTKNQLGQAKALLGIPIVPTVVPVG